METEGKPNQDWKADRYAQHAHFVPALGAPVLDLLRPQAGERILDLGCGDGVLTEKLAASGAVVVGAGYAFYQNRVEKRAEDVSSALFQGLRSERGKISPNPKTE